MTGNLKQDSDSDYNLIDGAQSCWITVNDVSVWVRRTDEGVEVQLFPHHLESHPPVDMAFVSHEEAAKRKDRYTTDTSHIGA